MLHSLMARYIIYAVFSPPDGIFGVEREVHQICSAFPDDACLMSGANPSGIPDFRAILIQQRKIATDRCLWINRGEIGAFQHAMEEHGRFWTCTPIKA